MSEKDLDEQTAELLEELGYVFYKIHGSTMQRSGLPDFIAYRGGQLVCIENKNPNGKGHLTALQYVKLKAFADEGALAIVSDSLEYTESILICLEDLGYSHEHSFFCPDKYEKQALRGLETCSTNVSKG